MKLAEALILRADLQKRNEQIKNRLRNNIKIQEGDKPSECPKDLFIELEKNMEELSEIIIKINKTNIESILEDGRSIMELLIERDNIWNRRQTYSEMAELASSRQDIYTRTEIKYISTINVKEIQKKIDILSKEWRQLDTKIQSLNWTVDLL